MTKILLVTGKAASPDLKKLLRKLPVECDAHVCASNVAALLTPEVVEKELGEKDLSGYDWVLVPGAMRGDLSGLAKRLGLPVYKGSKNLAGLPAVLEEAQAGRLKLSSSKAADELVRERLMRDSGLEIRRALAARRGLRIGRKKPVYLSREIGRVVAEINDAASLSERDLIARARYYASSGADIIDIGMPAGGGSSAKVESIVAVLRSAVSVPLSIDSFDEKEILSAADAGIDLVLSVDLGNLEVLQSVNVPAVAVPRDGRGILPAGYEARVDLMEEIIEKAGRDDVIADLVLSPIGLGFAESLASYALFRKRDPCTEMMLGAGNVTEMIDADSPGINALLAGCASELGIGLLFTTEASPKTRGAVRELSVAARMACLSKKRNQPPKDLGTDLLMLKDKVSCPGAPAAGAPCVRARKAGREKMEDSHFSISVSDRIIVTCFRKGEPLMRIAGENARDLYSEMIRRRLVKDMGHCAYLGRELARAEIALALGKDYVQDAGLFKKR